MKLDFFFIVEKGIAFALEEIIVGVSDGVVLFSVEHCLYE